MKPHKITIGVVTHPKSSHPRSVWEQSIKEFSQFFKSLDFAVLTSICADNLFSTNQIPLFRIWKSKMANQILSIRWYHLKINKTSKFKLLILIFIATKQFLTYQFRTIISNDFRNHEKKIFKRSVNISLAHISIFEKAYSRNDSLLLIFEDDARYEKSKFLLNDLQRFVEIYLKQTALPGFVNLSKSLSWKQLQLIDLYEKKKYLDMTPNIFLPSLMFHNTTCANLYNAQYISKFNTDWKSQIEKYVLLGIPFDWIINALIIKLPTNEILTFHLHKPLVIQASMHP